MTDKFIIVKRDRMSRDIGVVTGSMTLVESKLFFLWEGHPLVLCEPEISEHIEHAFLFPGSWQAWRWIDRMVGNPELNRSVQFMTFDVRKHPNYQPGEQVTWGQITRVDLRATAAMVYGPTGSAA